MCALAFFFLFFLLRRKRKQHGKSQAAERMADAVVESQERVIEKGDAENPTAATDETPAEQVRHGGDPLVWTELGELPSDWNSITVQHREFIYAMDGNGRIFRMPHEDLSPHSELDIPSKPHCFSPIRRNPLALVASARSLVAVGTPGVGGPSVALAELGGDGEVASWHTAPCPEDFDALAAVAARGSTLWLMTAEAQRVRLLSMEIRAGRLSRTWKENAQFGIRGDLLAGAIVSRNAVALTELPNQPGYLSVFIASLTGNGGVSTSRRSALVWTRCSRHFRRTGTICFGPGIALWRQPVEPGPARGRQPAVRVGSRDYRGWKAQDRELSCQTSRGRLVARSRAATAAGGEKDWRLSAGACLTTPAAGSRDGRENHP